MLGAISITERTGYIGRVRTLASSVAHLYADSVRKWGIPCLEEPIMSTFVLEIGTEEPARFLSNVEKNWRIASRLGSKKLAIRFPP